MQLSGIIHTFPGKVKLFIFLFILSLSFGFFTGFSFLDKTTGLTPAGIEKNYLGNEEDEDATVMIFKKTKREMLALIHTHVLSMSIIFFVLGIILFTTSVKSGIKAFLVIEPFISIILTFGGLLLLWKGVLWFKYIIMVSGALLVLSYILSISLITWQLLIPDNNKVQSSNSKNKINSNSEIQKSKGV